MSSPTIMYLAQNGMSFSISFLRITLGIVFIASSVLKIIIIKTFAIEVGDYVDLYLPQWLNGLNMICAVGVCALEFFVGLLAFRKKQVVRMSVLSLLILTFFVWLTSVNYFFPTVFGSVESCGCFGELIHFTPLSSFIKSVVLWVEASALFVLVMLDRNNG